VGYISILLDLILLAFRVSDEIVLPPNEDAIKQWSEQRWPYINKAEEDKASIV
jgi:hypothetical protein